MQKHDIAAKGDFMFDHKDGHTESMNAAHFHNTYEIYYLNKGNGSITYLIDRKIYHITEGDLVLIPPQTLHRVLYTDFTSPVFSRYLLSFNDDYLHSDLKKTFDTHHYRILPEDRDIILDILKKLNEEFDLFDEYFQRMYKYYLTSLLVLLVRKYGSVNNDTYSQEELTKIDIAVSKIIDYIHKNIDKDISLTELSEKYGYTKEYISSQFKNTTGCGFNEYLNKTRIAHAVKLLISTALPIKLISDRCGFKDPNYFAAVFRSYMNMSPSKYRKINTVSAKDPE